MFSSRRSHAGVPTSETDKNKNVCPTALPNSRTGPDKNVCAMIQSERRLSLRRFPVICAVRTSYDQSDVVRLIDQLACASLQFQPDEPLNIVGIRTRGEMLAKRLTRCSGARLYPDRPRRARYHALSRRSLRNRPAAAGATDADRRRYQRRAAAAGGRCALHRSIDPRGAGCAERFRPPQRHPPGGSRRSAGRELPIQADFVGADAADRPQRHRVNVRFAETDGRDEIVVEPRNEMKRRSDDRDKAIDWKESCGN